MNRRLAGTALLCALTLAPVAQGEAPFVKGPPLTAEPGAVPGAAAGVELTAEEQALLAEMSDIRDIRPPVAYGWDPRWAVAGAVAALLAAGAGLLWWLRRRNSPPQAARAEPPPEPLEEVARRELAALTREAGLPDKEFYFRLCTAVRRYLDGRYGADTLERTTEELVPVLHALPLDSSLRTELVHLFRRADPVRYADVLAPGEARRADLASARALLHSAPVGAGEGR